MKEYYILDAFLPCLSLNLVSGLPQSGHQETSLPILIALPQLLHHLHSNSFLISLNLIDLYPSQKNNMAPANAATPRVVGTIICSRYFLASKNLNSSYQKSNRYKEITHFSLPLKAKFIALQLLFFSSLYIKSKPSNAMTDPIGIFRP